MTNRPEVPPPAGPDRRFYAFVLDRLLAWALLAVAGWATYWLVDQDRLGAGIAVAAGAVVLVWLVSSLALGLWGVSPGKAMVGLRLRHVQDGGPIGVPRALLRGAILGVATLPTLGLGTAALAWTALADPTGLRRAWHDRRASSVVLDVRPAPVVDEPEEEGPRPLVNLTAMRLVPASAPPASAPPAHIPDRPPAAPVPASAAVAANPGLDPTTGPQAPTVTPRQGLGWPLVGPPPPPPTARRGGPRPPPPTRRPPPPPSTAAAPTTTTPPTTATPPTPPPPPPDQRTHVRRPRTAARWRVSFDTGESFVVDGLTLVGRKPEARSGEPVRQLVSLPSDDMSLSKTHAQFQVVPDGALVVMDRGSTNGSILIRSGVTRRLAGGKPATLREGDRVRFGDREMTVSRES